MQEQKQASGFVSLLVMLTLIVLSATFVSARAASMETVLSPNQNESTVKYESVQVVNIRYPQGSDIASQLVGENIEVSFMVGSEDHAIQTLMKDMNAYLLRERGSTAVVKDLAVDYKEIIKGYDFAASISIKVTILMTLFGYVLGDVHDDENGKLMDLNWRTFVMSQPVLVQTEKYGLIDINRPSGLILATVPSLMESIIGEGTMELLNYPAMDFSAFATPLDQWRIDFDRFAHIEGSNGVTIIATRGVSQDDIKVYKAKFEHRGMPHELSLTLSPPSGTIQVPGFAKAYADGANEGVIVYENPTDVSVLGRMPLQILVGLGVAVAAIAILVLYKARR